MTRTMIRIQYLIFGAFFFALGYGMLLYQKWHLPIGSPTYIRMEMIHGTIMVFFGIVPMLFMGLGHYVLPNDRGGQMRFPHLEWVAFGLLYISACFVIGAILLPGIVSFDFAFGLSVLAPMVCCVNFIATAIFPTGQAKALVKLWCVKWVLFILSFVLLINFLLLEIAVALKLETHFLNSSATLDSTTEAGPQLPVVWEHVFWFMGHPEVIILLLLSVGFFLDGVRFLFRKIFA